MVVLVIAYMRSVHDGDEPIVDGDNCVSGPSNRDRVRVLHHYALPRTHLVAFGKNSNDTRKTRLERPSSCVMSIKRANPACTRGAVHHMSGTAPHPPPQPSSPGITTCHPSHFHLSFLSVWWILSRNRGTSGKLRVFFHSFLAALFLIYTF